MGDKLTAAKAMLHFWEEPCLSVNGGSGAVFFSGCVLRCVYCQNYGISTEKYGKEITAERLAEIFLELQAQGAENIDLVNPTHFVPQIISALRLAKERGLTLPIVYNSGGYEKVETLKMLDGLINVYLPDVKYFDDELAKKLSNAPNYFNTALTAVEEMIRQTGKPVLENGKLLWGTMVRHLVLPNCYKDSVEIVRRLGERFGSDILFSLMSQYTPFGRVRTDPEFSKMNRRITTFEYNKVLDAVIEAGLDGYMQERSSAKEEYTPEFDLSGL
ncbi:MAG: radical SAM protein [Oscillospiraceae bacterium]|nr:radical SAM protein [Oscillospiraceae bacterium]